MSLVDDADPDILISRLAGPLLPADRAAFRAAAEDALSKVPCWGEGAVYRAVAALQRAYFHPPPDPRRYEPRHYRLAKSKLASLPAIGADDPRTGGRERSRLRAV
jgi:hypothetical protein